MYYTRAYTRTSTSASVSKNSADSVRWPRVSRFNRTLTCDRHRLRHTAKTIKMQVCVQVPTYANNVALPAFASRASLLQQSTDISCVLRPQQQTCSTEFAVVGPRWERQTDGHRTVS